MSPPAPASIDLASGDLVVSEQSPPTLYGVDRTTGASRGSCPCSACTSSIRDVAVRGTSEIYVTTPAAIVEILAASCASRIVAETDVEFGTFSGIALDASGALLVTASDCAACARADFLEYGGLLRFDRITGARSVVFSGPPMIGPDGLAVAPDGRVYVAAQSTEAEFDSGVVRIDPQNPATPTFVAIGDDVSEPADRMDIVSAMDIAIESDEGPVYVLDSRYRGSTLQDEMRLVAVDLGGAPTSNQTLLTNALEGINQDRSSGSVWGIAVADGTILTLDYVFSSGSSSDWGGIVAFTPGISVEEGTRVTDASAFYYPSGLAIVPEPGTTSLAVSACVVLLSLVSRRAARIE